MMVSRMLQLKCAGYGANVTRADAWKAAAVTLGGTLALALAATWGMWRYGKGPYLEALLSIGWLVPFLFSQRYTSLKGRPGRVQAVLIGGPVAIVIAIALSAAWLNSN